jgi:hypothetical protein
MEITLRLNTGEVGIVSMDVSEEDGFFIMRIFYMETLSSGAVSQNFVTVVNRDLAPLITAALDSILIARFGVTQNVEGILVDNAAMTITMNGG